MLINVFVSVGRVLSPQQETFLALVQDKLKREGFRHRTVGRTDNSRQPLLLVDRLMDKCAAAVVIACERIVIEKGLERRSSEHQDTISHQGLPTPWNQIEAAFAYAKRLPVLVIKEEGVRGEGLLEPGYDWYVHSTPLTADFLVSDRFLGIFDEWQLDAKRRAGWFKCRG